MKQKNDRAFYRKFFTVYIALVLQNVVTLSVNLADNIMLGGYSEVALSGAAAVNQIQFVFQQMIMALGDGLVILSSQYWGKRQTEPMKKIAAQAMHAALFVTVCLFLLVSLFPREILELFGSNTEEYFEFGVKFFQIFMFFTWLNFLQPITSNFFTAIGTSKKGVFLALTRQLIFFLPLLLILPLFYGLEGILYVAPISDLISAAVTIWMVAVEFRLIRKLEAEEQAVSG